eukprot:TRINITY_DN32030_c0_g1_i1.p1 TRINITY_DN32030_c0_g1~~TRINITY_DN32030_c0_g1_i1.p1  ORF type:complete len:411 (+),score=81.66 TRINITY_DN32030_c0_g1_i1:75-1307(+)
MGYLPYDVFMFVGFWLLAMVAWGVLECCKYRQRRRAAQPLDLTSTLVSTASFDQSEPMGRSGCFQGTQGRMRRRCLIFFACGGVGAWCMTVFVLLILLASGFLESLLFSPQRASECVAKCDYGKDGWVDDDCCTYEQNVGQQDVYLKFEANGGAYVTHGYLMVNATRAYPNQTRLTLLYNHGSGGNVASGYRLERYEYLLAVGNVAILAYDYPGFGKSSGKASHDLIVASSLNAAAWFAGWDAAGWAGDTGNATHPHAPMPSPEKADLARVVLLGRSLGGAVATNVGKTTGWVSQALVLQSTFSSVADLMHEYLPMFGWVWASLAPSRLPKFDVTANVIGFRHCYYLYHSRSDDWVPFILAKAIDERLSAVANSTCSHFVVAKRALHTQPLTPEERRSLGPWLNARGRMK